VRLEGLDQLKNAMKSNCEIKIYSCSLNSDVRYRNNPKAQPQCLTALATVHIGKEYVVICITSAVGNRQESYISLSIKI
jgi:hypothetical protein